MLDKAIGFLFLNFKEIINSYALYMFLEHIKTWEVSQF